jgi:hypothetical protein
MEKELPMYQTVKRINEVVETPANTGVFASVGRVKLLVEGLAEALQTLF